MCSPKYMIYAKHFLESGQRPASSIIIYNGQASGAAARMQCVKTRHLAYEPAGKNETNLQKF